MLVSQRGRRNLSPHEFKLFIRRLYNSRKKTQGGDRKSKAHNGLLKSTSKSIADEHGTSKNTVKRAAKQAEAIDTKATPELKEAVRNHEVSLSAAAEVA